MEEGVGEGGWGKRGEAAVGCDNVRSLGKMMMSSGVVVSTLNLLYFEKVVELEFRG